MSTPAITTASVHDTYRRSDLFQCSECHCRFELTDGELEQPTFWEADGTGSLPHFCPGCGAPIAWDKHPEA